MSKLVIISAPSGTGKSTLANNMVKSLHSQGKYAFIFSTDNFWKTPSGDYNFNAALLGKAHDWNYNKYKDFVQDSDFSNQDVVAIIDNTNLQWKEFSRYIELALLSKWEVEIIRLECPYTDEELFKRNVHSVPVEVIHRQRERWQSREYFNNELERLKQKLGVCTKE